MKNKVMGKALSWVLSAAMALTMSGAIPAMTTNVYAASTAGTYFATNYSTLSSAIGDTLKMGYTTSGLNTKTPLSWKIKSTKSTGSDKTAGVFNVEYDYAESTYSTTWKTALETALTNSQFDMNSLFKGTVINTDGDHNYVVTAGDDTKAAVTDPGVNTTLYLPSSYEVLTGDESYAAKKYWTRDTLTTTAANYNTVYTTKGTVASASNPTAVIASDNTKSATYAVNGNIDLASDTSKSKILFATVAEGVTTLTVVNSTFTKPDVKSVDMTTTSGEAVITLNTAVPDGYSVGYFAVTGNKLYSAADAALASNTMGADIAISTDKKTITIGGTTKDATNIASGKEVYVYYYKTADDTVTKVASTPVDLTMVGKSAPTSANFKIADYVYTGTAAAASTLASGLTVTAVADTGYTASTTTLSLTNAKLYKDGKVVADTPTITLHVGDTYTLVADVPSWSETKGSETKTFAAQTGFTVGTVTIKPAEITAITTNGFALDTVAQYSAVNYTVASLALKSAGTTTIKGTDKVNATNAKVELADTKGASTTAIVYISTLDNKDYYINGTIKVTGAGVTITQAAMTGISISRQPSTTTYVEGAAPTMVGLELKATYEGNGTQYLTDTSKFTFSPSLSTKQVAGTVDYAVSYKDAASGKTFTAPTKISITFVKDAVALTKISIPSTSDINISQSLDLPTVRYTPTDTTVAKTVEWYYKAGTPAALTFADDTQSVQAGSTTGSSITAFVDGSASTSTLDLTTYTKLPSTITKYVGSVASSSSSDTASLIAVVNDGSKNYAATQAVVSVNPKLGQLLIEF
jgi:hypothetical protein